MMNEEKKDLIELITKIVTAASALIAGIAIPVVLNYNEEKNRQSQLYVQIMSQREQSDSALRERMFNALITSYFGKEVATDPEKQIMYLHLLTLNFQEFFDAKPLFEDLDKKLTGESRRRLQHIAREVGDRQVNMLTKPDHKPAELMLCREQLDDCTATGAFSVKGRQRDYHFNVELLRVGESEVFLRVSPAQGATPAESFDFKPIEFEVSYYDTPFMNNTRLTDGSRFAFALKNSDPKAKIALLKVVTFPEEFMSLRDRPYFDEMLAKVREENGGNFLKR
ncbi:MAG: hypothetical protein ACOYW7_10155 [Nitrospirota bacterium]